MKLIYILIAVFALACAEEDPRDKMVQLCGAQLAKAVQRVCGDGDLQFLNLQPVEHKHEHNHQHDHQHEAHEHSRDLHSKKDTTSTLSDMCCAKPCHIKEFVSYCP